MKEIGRNIIRLESVDSTNNYTANRARMDDLPHGAVILAVEQTGGKGQMGAKWTSQPGMNLTFSIFLDNVNLSVERQFILTKIVSLSLIDLLLGFELPAKIKWPNDIYINDSKIAGVLIENSLKGAQIVRSIIGIGLNVNQQEFENLNATSLRLESGHSISNDELLFSFIAKMNQHIDRETDPQLHNDYLNSLYWRDEIREFQDQEGTFQGRIIDVAPNGKLIVEREGGMVEFDLKEIRFIR